MFACSISICWFAYRDKIGNFVRCFFFFFLWVCFSDMLTHICSAMRISRELWRCSLTVLEREWISYSQRRRTRTNDNNNTSESESERESQQGKKVNDANARANKTKWKQNENKSKNCTNLHQPVVGVVISISQLYACGCVCAYAGLVYPFFSSIFICYMQG